MLWLAIAFVRLPLEVVAGARCGVATAVQERQTILLASEEAQEHGVVPGQKTASAHALCDNLTVVERQATQEAQKLEKLAERLLFVTPDISLSPPHTLLLNIQGSLKLFQGKARLLGAVQKSLRGTGHYYHAGLGHTPLAADILAQHHDDLRTLAYQFPDATSFHLAIDQTPIASLPLPEALIEALQAPGFHTVAELHALPEGALGKRHGKQLLDWLDKLRGNKPDPRQPIRPAEFFQSEVNFNEPVDNCTQLLFPARRLLAEMNYFLRQRQLRTGAIRWQLYGQRHEQTIVIRRASTHQDLSLWTELTRRKFEQTLLQDGVLKMRLNCERPASSEDKTDSLFFDPSARPSPETLLEKLHALPQLTLFRPQECDDYLPENMQALSDPFTQPTRHKTFNTLPSEQDFPLWLLDAPHPLKLRDQSLIWRGAVMTLLPHEMRLSLNWWQQPAQRRYFIALHPKGLCCWVFLNELDNSWYLHGFF